MLTKSANKQIKELIPLSDFRGEENIKNIVDYLTDMAIKNDVGYQVKCHIKSVPPNKVVPNRAGQAFRFSDISAVMGMYLNPPITLMK